MGIESLLSFLIVIPEVITDAEGRNGGDLVFGVFPPSNRGRKIYLWQVASRKLVVFGIYFGSTCPRTFLEDSCHEQPARLSELEVPVSPGGRVEVTGNVHKAAAVSHARLWTLQ